MKRPNTNRIRAVNTRRTSVALDYYGIGLETVRKQAQKMPARGARKPDLDEQERRA